MTSRERSSHEASRPHILFVCGRNMLRSPTAERLYRRDARVEVRSAGVSASATHTVSASDLHWADLILVMETRYASAIRRRFRSLEIPSIRSLDVPDDYNFMQPELVQVLQSSIEPEIARLLASGTSGSPYTIVC